MILESRKSSYWYRRVFKRGLDLSISITGLIILSPLILLTIISILVIDKQKPFFIQQRPGKDGMIFNFIKFRTMRLLHDEHGNLLPDVRRTTGLGKILRLTSVDELPQIFNVIIGNMSIIGPRPLLTKYLTLYNDFQLRRHEVKPGITGWSQINGRNAISWEKKFEYDVWYVDNLSFKLDMEILLKTVLIVFARRGINSSDARTMEAFTGNK